MTHVRLAAASSLLALALAASGCPKKTEPAGPAYPSPTATPPSPQPGPEEPGPGPGPQSAGRGRVDPETVPWETRLKAANGWNGTYRNLLAVVHAPEDRASYSPFSEYGWKDAQPYKEYGLQPAGWWVYVEPYWFVFDTRNGDRKVGGGPGAAVSSDGTIPPAAPGVRAGLVDPGTLPPGILVRAASGRDAKYTNALAAVHDPEDAKSVTKHSEYGWRDTTSYKTYGQVPAGWWVYVEPYWVVWNLKDGKPGP